MKLHRPAPVPRDLFLGSALLLALTLMATGWLGWLLLGSPRSSPQSANPTASAPTERLVMLESGQSSQRSSPAHPTIAQPAVRSAQVYWLRTEGDRILLVGQPIATQPQTSPSQTLRQTLTHLLSQNPSPGETTTIPAGTRLLDLRVETDGIHINLSREFGQGGGSSSLIHRVAQVLYTATSLDPQAPVYLSVEGHLLNEQHPLGGEGLTLPTPITRQRFVQEFSL